MTKLVTIRQPNEIEARGGAEVVFVRETTAGHEYVIYASREGQWGEAEAVSDNLVCFASWLGL